MKQRLVFLALLTLLSLTVRGDNENFVKIGDWGSGYYQAITVNNHYAYCYTDAVANGIFDIIDVSQPAKPVKVNHYITSTGLRKQFLSGNYLYGVTKDYQLLVLDITDPQVPKEVAKFGVNQNINDVFVSGHYAYCNRDLNKLMILDVADPAGIKEISLYQIQDRYIYGMYVTGNYAYLNCYRKMEIVDISNPAAPVLLGEYPYGSYQEGDVTYDWYGTRQIQVKGDYAYLALEREDPDYSYSSIRGLFVIDIRSPAKPLKKNFFENFSIKEVAGDYAYTWGYHYLGIIDLSDPASPRVAGKLELDVTVCGLFVKDHYAYLAAEENGLLVADVGDPSHPALVGQFDESGQAKDVKIKGYYAYVARKGSGLDILDLSSPAAPVRVGSVAADYANIVALYGDYAYLADGEKGIRVINVSNPAAPVKTAQIPNLSFPRNFIVSGHYLYASENHRILVFDLSEPNAPAQVTELDVEKRISDFYIHRNWLYLLFSTHLSILDISDPSTPKQAGSYATNGVLSTVVARDNYVYVTSFYNGLYVIDARDPMNPVRAGQYDYNGNLLLAEGNNLYLRDEGNRLLTIDITNPHSPWLAGWYQSDLDFAAADKSWKYVYLASGSSGKLLILKFIKTDHPAYLTLSRSYVHFAGTTAFGPHTSPQTVLIGNSGETDIHWTITKEIPVDSDWLKCTPMSGTNSGEITLTADPAQLWHICNCTYKATLVVSAPEAVNSTRTIDVDLRMWESQETAQPFGEFATPLAGSVASGNIPVTGWALDDLEVKSVGIYRQSDSGLVYVGDGSFIEGARPDVDEAYSWYPLNYRAGWGYMLLTNFLPDGPVTLHALATDLEGNRVTLGKKTITVDNKNAQDPYGTLDTPSQGGYASGRDYLSWGWAVTPQPNTIPFDGSTITVWVDGIPLGHPVYDRYREDVAAYFPGNNNSDGAGGYFYLDTTTFINGVHTISWSVSDDAGNSQGIGSRYFVIANTGTKDVSRTGEAATAVKRTPLPHTSLAALEKIPLESTPSVEFVKGCHRQSKPVIALADDRGSIRIQIRQLERLEIHLNPRSQGLTGDSTAPGQGQPQADYNASSADSQETFIGCQRVGRQLKSLPLGSYLDPAAGVFYWQPCAGFVGTYRLVFIHENRNGNKGRLEVEITIVP